MKVVRYGPADDGGPGNDGETAIAGVEVTLGRAVEGKRLLPSPAGTPFRLPPCNGIVAALVGDWGVWGAGKTNTLPSSSSLLDLLLCMVPLEEIVSDTVIFVEA